MREITHHRIGILSRNVRLVALDTPGEGGANAAYQTMTPRPGGGTDVVPIKFQIGPVGSPADVNGISTEVLLALVIDRLQGAQGLLQQKTGVAGSPRKEQACALTHCEEALLWMQKGTLALVAQQPDDSPVHRHV